MSVCIFPWHFLGPVFSALFDLALLGVDDNPVLTLQFWTLWHSGWAAFDRSFRASSRVAQRLDALVSTSFIYVLFVLFLFRVVQWAQVWWTEIKRNVQRFAKVSWIKPQKQMLQGAFAEFTGINSQYRKGRIMPDMSSQSFATMISDHEMLWAMDTNYINDANWCKREIMMNHSQLIYTFSIIFHWRWTQLLCFTSSAVGSLDLRISGISLPDCVCQFEQIPPLTSLLTFGEFCTKHCDVQEQMWKAVTGCIWNSAPCFHSLIAGEFAASGIAEPSVVARV